MSPTDLVEQLATVPDPQVARTRVHRLEEVLAIALLAAIDGADGWDDIADFAEDRESWLRAFLDLPGGHLARTRTAASSKRSTRRRSGPASLR